MTMTPIRVPRLVSKRVLAARLRLASGGRVEPRVVDDVERLIEAGLAGLIADASRAKRIENAELRARGLSWGRKTLKHHHLPKAYLVEGITLAQACASAAQEVKREIGAPEVA